MAEAAPTYDLTLLLSLNAPDEQRVKVLSDVETAIGTAGGSVVNNADWGRRPTAYQIRHEAEAEYHLLQFHAPAQTIDELSHTLRITDGVLRFRVIKLRPGTPPAPSSAPPVVAAAPAPSSQASAAASPAPAEPAPAGADGAPSPPEPALSAVGTDDELAAANGQPGGEEAQDAAETPAEE